MAWLKKIVKPNILRVLSLMSKDFSERGDEVSASLASLAESMRDCILNSAYKLTVLHVNSLLEGSESPCKSMRRTERAEQLHGRGSTVMVEAILAIFRGAGASERELEEVRGFLQAWRRGCLTSRQLYFALMGYARENLIPLTPRQVGELQRMLG
ncbi:hypothetical protein [Stetteria hydrogenophila]